MNNPTSAEIILPLVFAVFLQIGALGCVYWAMLKLARLTP
jgi:CHASE3 domain sensor protein